MMFPSVSTRCWGRFSCSSSACFRILTVCLFPSLTDVRHRYVWLAGYISKSVSSSMVVDCCFSCVFDVVYWRPIHQLPLCLPFLLSLSICVIVSIWLLTSVARKLFALRRRQVTLSSNFGKLNNALESFTVENVCSSEDFFLKTMSFKLLRLL